MREADPAPISYLALFFVVALAVTCGNLLSNWITARAAAYAMEQATRTARHRKISVKQVAEMRDFLGLQVVTDGPYEFMPQSAYADVVASI